MASVDTSWKGTLHKVPARNEARLLVEVEVIPQNGCDIGGQHVKQGTHRVVIYASELPDAKAYVRTEKAKADFARAEQIFANQLANLVKGLGETSYDKAERERRVAEYGESPYSIMAQDPAYTGGFGKLMRLEVIEEVPPPPTMETLQANQFDRLSSVLAGALGGGAGPTPEQIDARVNALVEARLADLEKRISERYRTK